MKYLIAIIIFLIISIGLFSRTMKIFKSVFHSFKCPKSYIVEKSEGKPEVITVKGKKGRVEIFKTSDFDIERIHGYSSSGIEEFEWKLVPKAKLSKGDFTIWLFYHKDDIISKKGCEGIFKSFRLKKRGTIIDAL